jgi:hypothetical protein
MLVTIGLVLTMSKYRAQFSIILGIMPFLSRFVLAKNVTFYAYITVVMISPNINNFDSMQQIVFDIFSLTPPLIDQ